jgi:hypothetical protein
MEEENIRSCPEGTEGKSGGYFERRKTESAFEKVTASRRRFFSKKGSDADIHKQKSGGGILERKYSIQRVLWQQKKKSNETENQRCDKEQSLDCDKSKISKMAQSMQIIPKTK